jgi:hypothetical protein
MGSRVSGCIILRRAKPTIGPAAMIDHTICDLINEAQIPIARFPDPKNSVSL